ncbi:ISAzo13 family transposase [Nonomuraea sp. NPDC049129]|uniref:ISAzo13 family transposase n=1 Tax=Nonomuraea sp. NPDC049129 TaxID=3155272 RepID=UPI0033F2E6A9
MAVPSEVREQVGLRFEVLLPHLNERQRRLLLAAEARLLGHGGVRAVAEIAGVSESTVRKGVFELEGGEDPFPDGRVRRPGGGRKQAGQLDPELVSALLALVEPDERGDPMSPLRWTTKSLRNLAEELTRQGHQVSAPTVGRLLRASGFSLQGNAKTLEGKQHPDRDAQFRYINEQVKEHLAAGEPVVSVDTKKKEYLGRLPMAGTQWRPKDEPVEVEDHSFFFTGPDIQHAIPYGIYDLAADAGWVNVGVDHDTSAFAAASIRRWWQARGCSDYPDATRLLITADAGGSNGYRYRAWKTEMAAFAAEAALDVTVCHFPPGTSKWNKIEHRLFSHITMNWRGRPLTSHEVVVNTIAATRTRTGLTVQAELDTGSYPTGVAVTKAQVEALPIERHAHHGEWNYTIRATTGEPGILLVGKAGTQARADALALLADPRLTGMSRTELDALAARLASAQAARTEERLYQQRGGRRRKAQGDHGRRLFSDADRVLITVVYLRQVCSQKALCELLATNPVTIGQAVRETRKLLDQKHIVLATTSLAFATATDLHNYLEHGITVGRSPLPEALSDPKLTGMSRQQLHQLTERLALPHAAAVERRRHRQRGGDRTPGTRRGVFKQKLTDPERILATVLYLRTLCTREVLAEAFDLSRGTISNAIAEVVPLLKEADITIEPASTRFRTAIDMIASVESGSEPTTPTEPPC